MTYREWHVGMKVVCVLPVDGGSRGEVKPVVNKVYTLRDIYLHRGFDVVAVRLTEIVNVPRQYADGFAECAFPAFCFRPVQPRSTDISIFEAMLTGAEEREPA